MLFSLQGPGDLGREILIGDLATGCRSEDGEN